MVSRAPRICCLDLDTFFVSVERLLDPRLNGRPVIIGGDRDGRGVVTSCSYEVRPLGVRSGMSIREASALAPPDTVFLRGSHSVYGPYSKRVKALLGDFTPEVRAASIDEFYLDFSGCEGLYRAPGDADDDATIERVVWQMRDAVQAQIGLPASVGMGCTRIVAKMASRPAKPAGVAVVRAGQEWDFFRDLPVRALPGIGPSGEARLHADGLTTLGQLVLLRGPLRKRYARLIERIHRAMEGDDRHALGRDRPAFQEHDPSGLSVGSISNERTFFSSLSEPERVTQQLLGLADRVCWRARKRGIRACTITLKLRTSDFKTTTRSKTIRPTDSPDQVFQVVRTLLDRHWTRKRAVRLLGVGLSNLVQPDPQFTLDLAPAPTTASPAVDALRARFGFDAIRLGVATPVKAKPAAAPAPAVP